MPGLLSRVAFLSLLPALFAQSPAQVDPVSLVRKIQNEIAAPLSDRDTISIGPRGEFLHGSVSNPRSYPGTENDFQIYVPREFDSTPSACLLLKLDGIGPYEASVLDQLIAAKEIPVTIAVGLSPGAVWKDPPGTPKRRAYRFNRSYEFDSMNDRFPEFVIEELLPSVSKMRTTDGRRIVISTNGNDHAVMGASTGGIGSFTLAWRRPDQFSRVYSEIGTFVSMRGGNAYPELIRKTDPKPIRVFLEDGLEDAWNPLFGSWFDANLNVDSALNFAGYDEAHAWGHHGHDARPGQAVLPDVLRWLWRGYPNSIQAGRSQNSTLQEVTLENQRWEEVPQSFQSAAGLAADTKGDVYFSDSGRAAIYRIGPEMRPTVFHRELAITAEAFGPEGTLYGLDRSQKRIVAIDPHGELRTVAQEITGDNITVTPEGNLYVTEPGLHSDLASRIWEFTPRGEKKLIDEGLHSASGLAFSPDRSLFFAAESTTKWIYSYVVNANTAISEKQPFYWLDTDDISGNSGAEDLGVDIHGNLYVATRTGIQICDQNGRVRAILPLPAPARAVRSLCFGGEHFDWLYATDGQHVFRRHLKVAGLPSWAEPVSFPRIGPG